MPPKKPTKKADKPKEEKVITKEEKLQSPAEESVITEKDTIDIHDRDGRLIAKDVPSSNEKPKEKEEPESAMIELHSKPEGAIIIINGANTGQVTPYAFEFPPGEHMIGMAMPKPKEAEEIVTGSAVDLSLKLDEVFGGVVSKLTHLETALDRVLEKLDELKKG